jgi:hypothetical protein
MNESDTNTLLNTILKNQEIRTEELISLEKYKIFNLISYFNKLLEILEREWKTEKKIHNWDYLGYCKKYIEKVEKLNKELRSLQSNNCIYTNDINSILSLEENNYRTTLGIFVKKINHFELLKKNSDEEEIESNDEDIIQLKIKKSEIREKLNDLIEDLKYSRKSNN